MEYLVGICVPDSAEEPGVGERSLERVILADERRPKVLEVACEHFDSTRIDTGESHFALEDVERRPPLSTGFGEDQAPGGEIERREAEAPIERRSWSAPVEPARDHEMEDEEELPLDADHEPLSDSPELEHRAAGGGGDRGIDRLQEKRARDPDALEDLALDPRRELFQIDRQIRKLGHAGLSSRIACLARGS